MITLAIQLIPEKNHGNNLRRYISRDEWNSIRWAAYKRDKYTCTACRQDGLELHAHEVWDYFNGQQTLKDITTLCKDCHAVAHWGRTQRVSDEQQMYFYFQHMLRVNRWTVSRGHEYLANVAAEFRTRNQVPWRVNLDGWQTKALSFLQRQSENARSSGVSHPDTSQGRNPPVRSVGGSRSVSKS